MIEPDDAPIGTASVARWWPLTAIPGVIVALFLVALIRNYFEPAVAAPKIPSGPVGTRSFEGLQRNHRPGAVSYPEVPPVGGDHAPIWATCGVYSSVVAPELAVHSMEHGAVWVTYDAHALTSGDIAYLEGFVESNYHGPERLLILSPFDGLPSPVVATAWGRQLQLNDPRDERLGQFVRDFRGGPQAPEPGLPCFNGGLGVPSDAASGAGEDHTASHP